MKTNNQYYSNKYCSQIPIIGYGEQFKTYLDSKFKNIIDVDDLNKVDEHLTDVIINVEGNIANAIEISQNNISNKIDSSDKHVICHVQHIVNDSTKETACNIKKAKENIICSVTNSTNTIIESNEAVAEKVIKSTEIIAGNIEKNLSNAITTSADNVANVVRDEAALAKIRMDKIREDLIGAINNTNDLCSAGFTDLNNSIILNKEDTVYRVNTQANYNKNEILEAINNQEFVPYDVYGNVVYNIVHPTIASITEQDILNMIKIEVKNYTPSIVYSLKLKDIPVIGMNDDPTGELYRNAKEQNEMNIVFAYPKTYVNTNILDSIEVDITKHFDKKIVIVNGIEYIVAMQTTKVVNLYDPQWETPLDYTLNYTLKISK